MPDETPAHGMPAAGSTLTVQVEGTAREGMRLYIMERPVDGQVRLQEWRGEDMSTGPIQREADAAALYEEFERAHRERRRMSEELYRVRLWLEGTGR